MEIGNPFILKNYISKEFFCDREIELENLEKNVKNGIDTTLFADRKIGKTGLIYRFFDYLEEKNSPDISIYVDIFSSRCLDDCRCQRRNAYAADSKGVFNKIQ